MQELPRAMNEIVRVQRVEYRGRDRLDVRVYFKPLGSEEWRPTRRGVNIALERAADLAAAIIREAGLTVEDVQFVLDEEE